MRLKRIIAVLVVFGLIGAAGYVAYRMMSGPAQGTVSNIIPESASSKQPVVELEQYDGKYFSFAHPSNYAQRTVKDPPPSSLETVQFVASGVINKLVSITLTPLPSGRLEDDASYYMRSIHPETYKLTKIQLRGEPAVVSLNTQDYQQALFWVHAGKLMTFALSSVTMDTSTTNDEYQQMMQSIRWR